MIGAGRSSGASSAPLVLVFGGSFDPPHIGHVELPELVRALLLADEVIYVPAARNPLKSEGPKAGNSDRLAMLEAALQGRTRSRIWAGELNRGPGASYTIDTLRQLRDELPAGSAIRLLIGADQAASFHRWREPRAIIELADPVVMLRRPAESRDRLLAELKGSGAWSEQELDAWMRRIVDVPLIDASATAIRDRLCAGPQGLEDSVVVSLVPESVRRVIAQRRLYRDS